MTHNQPRESQDTIFYDGLCNVCTRSVRLLTTLDWLNNLQTRDLTTTPPHQLPCDPADALRGMPMRTANGTVLIGFPAVRRALRRTPLGFLPALTLHIPLLSHAARAAYDAFAKRRPRACATSPTKPNP